MTKLAHWARTALGLSILLLAACTQGATGLPGGAKIFGGASVARMLNQCSRQAPPPGEGNWTPRAEDIVAFEALLPDALRAQRPERDWSAFPGQWVRQYVGIVRGGHRYVYGNFLPRHGDGPPQDKVAIVCDGGASFFGAEYDVEAGKLSHLAFNGRP